MRASDLNPSVRQSGANLHNRFDGAQPFRYLVIDDLLDESLFGSLVAEFPAFDKQHAVNEFGEVAGKAVRPDHLQLGSG